MYLKIKDTFFPLDENGKFTNMHALSIENKIESLEKVADFISEFATASGLSERFAFEMNLVLDELITNVITYGYSDKEPHKIDIEIDLNGKEVVMKVSDDGEEFNPLKHVPEDVNTSLREKSVGGLGILFVKQKSDSISYKRESGKNILTLSKKILNTEK